MSEFAARFPGKCAACGDGFPSGTIVTYVESALVEVECLDVPPAHYVTTAPAVEAPVDRSKVCLSCFCVHGAGQVECS